MIKRYKSLPSLLEGHAESILKDTTDDGEDNPQQILRRLYLKMNTPRNNILYDTKLNPLFHMFLSLPPFQQRNICTYRKMKISHLAYR